MISIVTAYYNRKRLFTRTLDSIKEQNFSSNFEVIAVDDGSEEHERLEDLITIYPFLRVIRLEKKDKWYNNSCIPFNLGFKAAKGDKIIIQNPECLHHSNILEYTENHLKTGDYISYSCFSLNKESTNNIESTRKNIDHIVAQNNACVESDGDAGWYNHPVFRPKAYHFCTAITKKDLVSLGGFDELYSLGIAFDDDDFLSRIKKKKMNISFIEDQLVLHQNHYSPSSTSYQNRQFKNNLMKRNQKLYSKLSKKNYIKANVVSQFLNLKTKKLYIKLIVNLLERV